MANERTASAKSSIVRASSLSGEDGVCDMCCHETKDWAVGQCDHPTCLRCSTKLRLLCGQKECPVCRFTLKKVLLVYHIKPYSSYANVHRWRFDKKNGVLFQDQRLQDAYYSLMENKCTKCSEPAFRTFKLLRDHMNRAHNLHYCDICVDNLKLFPSEFKTYTRRDLTQHRREGDKDDSSHKGHPRCHFCDERFLDNDQLHAHLRKSHFWCHFCESDGKQDYFCDYPLLRKHFKDEHFLCEEGPCKNEKFTSVFRSKLDLQAHRASTHSKGLSKAEVKQLRHLDVGFSYGRERDEEESAPVRRPRYAAGRGGDYGNRGGRSGPGRSREQAEPSRPKPVDPPKPKKSSPPLPPTKTSPVDETKVPPPGFLTQPVQPPSSTTAIGSTPLALCSSGQGYNWSSFDPYGDVTNTSETLHPVLGGELLPNNFKQPARSELSISTTNPPPGFTFPCAEEPKKTETTETEWPDLTSGTVPTVSIFPPRILEQPVLGNITAAVMNVNQNREPNLLSESSFPSLGTVPNPTSASSDQVWPFVLETVDPPHSEQSKLLKFAVAATNSSSSTSGYSGPLSSSSRSIPAPYQATPAQWGGSALQLSSQNFPPMTLAPVMVGGSEMLGGSNQNDFNEKSTTVSTESSMRRSKQSQLIEKVRKSLDYDIDKFTHFKTLMGWYKNSEISVDEYKAQCLLLFGNNQWWEIGPELAELMPNPEKKNELLSSFGIRSGIGKSVTTTTSKKSRKRVPASVPTVWGTGPVVAPVRNYNRTAMSTGLSHDDYPTLGSAMHQPKSLPRPTSWNVVIQ